MSVLDLFKSGHWRRRPTSVSDEGVQQVGVIGCNLLQRLEDFEFEKARTVFSAAVNFCGD